MIKVIRNRFKDKLKASSRAVTFALVIILSCFVVIQGINAFSFNVHQAENPIWTDEQSASKEAAAENDFRDGRGIISVTLGEVSAGGVYIYVNGCIEASLSSGETKSLRVSVGDVLVAMGHGLVNDANVKITTAVGRIDCSILNYGISVGNKGRLLAIIKNFDM